MNWYTQRRLIYGISVVSIILALSLYVFRENIFPTVTCFDKKQNGYESGVDCGGTCSLMCTQDVIPLGIKWSRALVTAPNTYDIVAMVSNKNIDNTPRSLGYSFTVYGDAGQVLTIITGSTTVPVDGDFPVIKQNVNLTQTPKEVITKLSDSSHFKVAENPTSPTIREVNIRYEPGNIPRVYATIINTKRVTISNIPVRVVLYDMYDNAFATGETIIPFLDKEGIKDISFTWNIPFKQAPTKISIYPILDPFVAGK